MNYDIKIHGDPVHKASQIVFRKSLTLNKWAFKEFPPSKVGGSLDICIIHRDYLGFFVDV